MSSGGNPVLSLQSLSVPSFRTHFASLIAILSYVQQTGVIQNIGDLGKLMGGMLCNAGYVHGNTSR
jgi:hypothetical protein